MKIYLIRHGAALNDELVTGGKRQAFRAGSVLKELGFKREEVMLVSSPRPRAFQSAEIIREVCGLGEIQLADWLDARHFSDFIRGLMGCLADSKDLNAIILVGHAPHFEELLLGYFPERILFESGDVYEIEVESGTARKLGKEKEI